MKKILGLLVVSAVIISGATSCKSKQKVVEISGANIEAAQKGNSNATSNTNENYGTAGNVVNNANSAGNEKLVNEKFSMADGETNAAAFNKKYHVVVGSFSIQDNARRLQQTLKNEGNDAIVVVNERGMYRVLIASFDDYNQAHARINQISSRFPDAWVLVQK